MKLASPIDSLSHNADKGGIVICVNNESLTRSIARILRVL